MVSILVTRLHQPPALLVLPQQQQLRPEKFHRTKSFSVNRTPRLIQTNSRRWDSNAETFRTRNYDFDDFQDDDDDDDDDEDDDTDQWLDILEDFIDGVWIFKVFRSFGWMLPAIISSFLLTSGPKAFLMALAIPLGQSALSLVFQTIWGKPKNKTRRRGTSRRKPPPPPPKRPANYVDMDEEQYVEDERKTSGYQTWVAGDGVSSDNKSNGSSSSFGGWEELDGRTRPNKTGKRKTPSKSKMSRRDKRSEMPLLLRLLIAVFPFIGSWTRML
nr:uncharacterized protein [Tanacetum cinerariifolium]